MRAKSRRLSLALHHLQSVGQFASTDLDDLNLEEARPRASSVASSSVAGRRGHSQGSSVPKSGGTGTGSIPVTSGGGGRRRAGGSKYHDELGAGGLAMVPGREYAREQGGGVGASMSGSQFVTSSQDEEDGWGTSQSMGTGGTSAGLDGSDMTGAAAGVSSQSDDSESYSGSESESGTLGGITAGLHMPAFIQGMEEALLATVGRKDKKRARAGGKRKRGGKRRKKVGGDRAAGPKGGASPGAAGQRRRVLPEAAGARDSADPAAAEDGHLSQHAGPRPSMEIIYRSSERGRTKYSSETGGGNSSSSQAGTGGVGGATRRQRHENSRAGAGAFLKPSPRSVPLPFTQRAMAASGRSKSTG